MPRATLLFDLDGTLIDSAPGIANALSIVRAERGGEGIDAETVRPLVSLGAATLVRRALGSLARDATEDLAAFRTALRDLQADPAAIYPGVVDALIAFRDAGHTMAIVTNKPEGLSRALLEQLDLARYFATIVGGDTTGVAKPDPRPVERALAATRANAAQALFVGDSQVDAAAARACQLPFILFEGGYGGDQCLPEDIYARFAHFTALPELVAQLRIDAGKTPAQ